MNDLPYTKNDQHRQSLAQRVAALLLVLFGVSMVCVIPACGRVDASGQRAEGDGESDTSSGIAVTSTYLGAAVNDLLGDDVSPLVLASPGMCPGHFDLRPSQVAQLRRSRLLIRFVFQSSLDDRVSGVSESDFQIAVVKPIGGLCVPMTYADACRQVGRALVQCGLVESETIDHRCQLIESRLTALEQSIRSDLDDMLVERSAVVSSGHQAGFLRWLGFDVVGEFGSADMAPVSELDEAIEAARRSNAWCVVANRPEGDRLARMLAERVDAQCVVLENFPDPADAPQPFDQLVHRNVARLIEAAGP
jgi:ABC-type Zn uptake system ZnuABC Zn-binding protein ZnuA